MGSDLLSLLGLLVAQPALEFLVLSWVALRSWLWIPLGFYFLVLSFHLGTLLSLA